MFWIRIVVEALRAWRTGAIHAYTVPPKDRINRRILQTMFPVSPLYWALQPEGRIYVVFWDPLAACLLALPQVALS